MEKPSRCLHAEKTSTNLNREKRDVDTSIESNSPLQNSVKKGRYIEDAILSDESNESLTGHTLIITTKKHQIFRVDTPHGIAVLKVLRPESSSDRNIHALENELEVSNKVSHHLLRKSLAKVTHLDRQALLLECVPGIPISDVGKFSILSFLKVARDTVSFLLKLHEKNIFHLNLSCDHILFNPESNSLKIIGCGLSATFASKKSYVYSSELLERDLRFISPEQSGRINSEVDHRSDFYSLGIIFYKLLSGRYPFDCKDASKLIQMHIAHEPTPLHINDKNVPIPVSKMISKLLNKSIDERYQTTKGIMHDIDLLISEYHSNSRSMNSIGIAQHDKSDTLVIPQNLYGRSSEYNTLVTVKKRIIESSLFELVFVKGSSGAGMSSFAPYKLYSLFYLNLFAIIFSNRQVCSCVGNI